MTKKTFWNFNLQSESFWREVPKGFINSFKQYLRAKVCASNCRGSRLFVFRSHLCRSIFILANFHGGVCSEKHVQTVLLTNCKSFLHLMLVYLFLNTREIHIFQQINGSINNKWKLNLKATSEEFCYPGSNLGVKWHVAK